MSSTKRILTIFGATGQQGGSIIDVVLSRPELSAKYALRGITRDTTSSKSQSLASKGVELAQANIDDLESLKTALKGSYGVYGVTDYWSLRVPNAKEVEIQQGKNIFLAAKEAGVKHFVFSALPNVNTLSKGKYPGVEHFDGKAEVKEFVEANKGDMLASFYMPAMYIDFVKTLTKSFDGVPTLALPFPDENFAWPLLAPRRDGGKYVVGLFDAGEKANGVSVQGVSTWTTPKKVVTQLGEFIGKEVKFNTIPGEVFGSFLPEAIREDLTQMMEWIGEESYYGKGTEKKQGESDKFLIENPGLVDWPTFLKEGGPIEGL
nr:hypothetical protein B0A51_09833 [Rachicladosporium sp. CCFEE 5018]